MMLSKGELLSTLLTKEKAEGIQAKVAAAKEDWKNFHSNLHQKESTLEVQNSQPQESVAHCLFLFVTELNQFQCIQGPFPLPLVIPLNINGQLNNCKKKLHARMWKSLRK